MEDLCLGMGLVNVVMVVELRRVVVSVIAASPSRLALDLGPLLAVGLPSHHEVETQLLKSVVLKDPPIDSLLYSITPYPKLTSSENHTGLRWNDSNRGLIGSS